MRDLIICLFVAVLVVLPAALAMRASRHHTLDTDPDYFPEDVR